MIRGALLGATSAILVVLVIACPPPAPQTPAIDAGSSDVEMADVGADSFGCRSMCRRLKELGCPEADAFDGGDTCYRTCADAMTSGKIDLKPACVAGAGDVATARACGTIRCR